MENFDKIEELNRQNRIQKAYEERKMREKIIEEKSRADALARQKEQEEDQDYVLRAAREIELERKKAQDIKMAEKTKLLQI